MFVITGGGTGIGRALALLLAMRGERVMIIGRRQPCLEEVASHSSLIEICCADVSLSTDRQTIAAACLNVPQIKGLVHNAGVIEPIVSLEAMPEAGFSQVLATNLQAPLFITQRLLPQLAGGRVLHIGSGVAYFPVMGWSAYCISKAALSMLTRCWQREYDCEKTAFASVMPGIVDTDMQHIVRHSTDMDPNRLAFFHRLHRKNKLVSAETVAQWIGWLLLQLSPEAFAAQEWDIYDPSHHDAWLSPPFSVPSWEDIEREQ